MSMLSTLTTSGHQPNIHILDNGVSTILKQGLLNNKRKNKLANPHLHIKNAAERAIQKFSAHFIMCLCTAEPKYPGKQWDCFLSQSTLNLNLLRKCHFNPFLEYAALHGIFDYNKTTLSPLGIRFLVHKNTTNHCTWAPHGTDGYYICTALN